MRKKLTKSNVKSHTIRKGDKVLLLQKGTKTQSRYDPHSYWVSDVRGTQITATREHKIRIRDDKMFKRVTTKQQRQYKDARHPLKRYAKFTWEGNDTDTLDAAVSQPLHEPIIAAQPAEPQQRRQHQYPNRHLDPNIDINLQQKRIRQPPQRYDAQTGEWQ